MSSRILVDGDILVNKAAWAAESQGCSESHALETFHNYINAVELEALRTTNCSNFMYGIQGPGNFRYGIAKIRPYKGNRKGKKKPTHLTALRKWLLEERGATLVRNIETDDWLGVLSREGEDWIMSNDKDLLQIPGLHLRLRGGTAMSEERVSEKQALITFYRSMLAGDAADNIIGCPGVGAVGADRIFPYDADLSEYVMYNMVRKKYTTWLTSQDPKTSLSSSEILDMTDIMVEENAMLLWIQRAGKLAWGIPCPA